MCKKAHGVSCLHVQHLSSNSPKNQTSNIFHSSHKWSCSDQTKWKLWVSILKSQKTWNTDICLSWLDAPESSFNVLRAFTSSPWESSVYCWVLIGQSTGRVRFGWCRSRRASCSGPSAVMGWAEWVKGEGSGSADLWRWIWATQSSRQRGRPPAWRLSWGRGPPAGNRTQRIIRRRVIVLRRK